MSDDALFEEGSGGEAAAEGEAAVQEAAEKATKAAIATGSADPKVIGKAVQEALGPVFQQLGGNLQAVAEHLKGVEDRLPARPQTDTEDDFYSDPKATITKVVTEQVQQAVGPLMQTLLKDKFDGMVGKIAGEVDDEFGSGTYEEEFSEAMSAIIKDLPPNLRASESHIRMALDSLKGSKFRELSAKAAERAKEKEAAEERGGPGYSALGPGRPAPKAPKLSPEEKQFIEVVRSRNPGYSEKQYLESRDRGNTEDDWAHLRKAN